MRVAGETGLRFNILGPLEGWAGGQRLRFGGLVPERVLATLLLEPGKVLPVSRLVAAVWADAPPETASHQVRKAVSDLRRRIPAGEGLVVTDGPGYRAVLVGSQLDLTEFSALVSSASEAVAAGRPAAAVEGLAAALALWRGPVLSGMSSPVIEAAATALEERRLAAMEQLFELRLGLGGAADLVAELREVVCSYPLRENLRGQLMLALYRAGRQAEALEEYGRLQLLLVEELGIDPGPHLARLYERILRAAPDLETPAAGSPFLPLPVSYTESPCTLPYDIADFVGRDAELNRIFRRARETGGIIGIDGIGGSGKTSLAIRAAHQLVPDYPAGQIYVDLRGYSPDQKPITPADALGILLRALGLPGEKIPDDVPGRSALWQRLVYGKRALIVLDNASGASGIRSLLPAGSGSLVLVTCRTRLLDIDGAEWISIDTMTPEESGAFIATTLGARRVAAEPEAAAELARLCDHLPLALRIATARLDNRPRWTLGYMSERLRDETRRLDELSMGERSVAANLRLSYQVLAEESRTAFRLLALHPGSSIDVHAAAALLGTSPWHTEDRLEHLLDVHLLTQPELGVYSFHDLVSSFARGVDDGTEDSARKAAIERLLDYYLMATDLACALLFPGRRKILTGVSAEALVLPDLTDADRAGEWFAREQAALLSAVRLATRSGYDRHAVLLARNVAFYLNANGALNEYEPLCRAAVEAARRLGDAALLGVSLANLSVACWELGDFAEGIAVAQEGLDIAIRVGDSGTEAHLNSTLGLYESLHGRFPEALEHLERAIALERAMGLARAEAQSLTILSTLYEQWGRYQDAVIAARRSLDLCRQLGQHENEFVALIDLALAHVGLGEYAQAQVVITRAHEMSDGTREPGIVALAQALSANIAHHLGLVDQSAEHARSCLDHARSSASPLRRAKAENMIGWLLHKRGEHALAAELHTQAYTRAAGVNYRPEQAYALLGMSRAAEALGDHQTAADHRASCEELFAAMDVPVDRRRWQFGPPERDDVALCSPRPTWIDDLGALFEFLGEMCPHRGVLPCQLAHGGDPVWRHRSDERVQVLHACSVRAKELQQHPALLILPNRRIPCHLPDRTQRIG
ncbi:MAG TPA: BTAD domain-containing putative transcriptional regulator [Streptosporangiaceae bacterium]|nr:BTAD domain-containing putative transcriptional regulator [Streptosporangiaceae bacterium]